MVRRPFFLFSLLLLGAAAVQAAIVAVRSSDAPRAEGGASYERRDGIVCTACGSIRTDRQATPERAPGSPPASTTAR
jgi:hypothetical protein